MRVQLLVCFALFLVSPLIGEPRLNWMTNYSKAVLESRESNKPLLVFFTGSDWSGWGMKMKHELLDTEQFAEKIAGNFVCVLVDFPHYKTLPADEQIQNDALKSKFEVTEFPRMVLLSAEGIEIARFGYLEESGAKLADDLLSILANDKRLSDVMKLALKSSEAFTSSDLERFYKLAQELRREGDAKTLLELGLKSRDPLFFLLEKYRLLVEDGKGMDEETGRIRDELLKSDPQNEKKVHFSVALIDFQSLACSKHLLDPKIVIKPLEEYLKKFGASDKENVWRVEMMIAQFYLDYDQTNIALRHAEAAFQSAPKEMKGEIEQSLKYIRQEIAGEEIVSAPRP